MRFNSDMTGVEENTDFPLLPQGLYSCRVSNVEDGYSQAGDPMIKVTLEVISGEYVGRLAFDRILFPKKGSKAEKILGRSKHFLHSIDEPYEGAFVIDSDNWIGKKCDVFILHREYEGKTYANVRGYDPIDPETKKKLPGNTEIPF